MRLYRVAPVDPTARSGSRYHPGFVPVARGGNRIDNPGRYDTLYMSTSEACAIGEAFGLFQRWGDRLLDHPKGFVRQLVAFELPDSHALLDLDDAPNLVRQRLRPSDVVTRDRERTQRWAAAAFEEDHWAGVLWWSRYDADWTTCGLWCEPGAGQIPGLRIVDLTEIDSTIEAVAEASEVLGRSWG